MPAKERCLDECVTKCLDTHIAGSASETWLGDLLCSVLSGEQLSRSSICVAISSSRHASYPVYAKNFRPSRLITRSRYYPFTTRLGVADTDERF